MRRELIPVRTRVLQRAELRYRAWRYRTKHDPAEIRWLRSVLRPGETVVDAGAYRGVYTYWMRAGVGAAGEVFSFEPQPRLAESLRSCVDAFRWSNVTVVEAGLSDGAGERTLYAPGGGPTPCASLSEVRNQAGADRYVVPIETLDRFFEDRSSPTPISVIKCDVEGHELEAFRGAERILAEDQPRLLFECEARHMPDTPLDTVFDYLQSFGYRGRFFWRDQLLGMDQFDQGAHQVHGRQPYANNFVFEVPGRPLSQSGTQ